MQKAPKNTELGSSVDRANVSSKMTELINKRSNDEYRKWWWSDSEFYAQIFEDMAEVQRKYSEYSQGKLTQEQILETITLLGRVTGSCNVYLLKRPGTRSSDVGKERQQLVAYIREQCVELQKQLIGQSESKKPQDMSTEQSAIGKKHDASLLKIENEVPASAKKSARDKEASKTTNNTTVEIPNKDLPKERLIKKEVIPRPEIENRYTKTFTKMIGTRADTMGAKGIGNIGTAYTTDDILSGDPREKVFNESVYKAHILMLSELMRAKEKTNGDVLRLPKNKFVDGEFKGVQKKRNIISYEAEDIGKPKAPKGISALSKRFSAWLGSEWSSTHSKELPAIIGNQKAVQAYPNDGTLQQYMGEMGLSEEDLRCRSYEGQISSAKCELREMMENEETRSIKLEEFENLSPEELENLCSEYFTAILENGAYRMRVPQNKLSALFHSERFLTLFETGTSTGGAGAIWPRARFARYAFGTPIQSNCVSVEEPHPKNRYEKYGYLDNPYLMNSRSQKTAKAYGNVIITFKKSKVKDRCTVTFGDSLNHQATLMPTQANEPKLYSVARTYKLKLIRRALAFRAKELTNIFPPLDDYIELQYHGDLTIDDIESITFSGQPKVESLDDLMQLDYVLNRCKEHGIPVNLVEEKYDEEANKIFRTEQKVSDALTFYAKRDTYKEDLRKIFLAEEGTDEDRKKYAPLIENLIKEEPDFAAEKEKWKDIL